MRALDPDQRLAGMAALGLLVTMLLPWYRPTFVDGSRVTKTTLSAIDVFSFVEAAVLLVALGVFALLFARGERRGFHLPGGDGVVLFGAGLWAALLLFWRTLDQPDVADAVEVGITWGLFLAFVAAATLAAAGWRIRAAGRPEPPNPAAEPEAPTQVVPRRRTAGEQLTLEDDEPTRRMR